MINKYEGLFWAVDGLSLDGDRTGKKRSYIFDDTHVTNVTQLELKGDKVTRVT